MGWISAIGSIASGLFNAHSARAAQTDAQNYNTQVLQNRHQWEVADLRAAGLNPILSAMNSAGGAGIGAAPAGTMPDLGSTVNSSKAMRVQEKAVDNQYKIEQAKVDLETTKANKQFELMKAQIDNFSALAEKAIAEKKGLDIDNSWKDTLNRGKYGIQLANINALNGQAAAGYASAADHYSHIEVNRAQVGQINASMDSIRAAIPKMVEDGKISHWQAEKVKLYVERIKEHPDLYDSAVVGDLQRGAIGPALGVIDSVTGAYRNIRGGVHISDSYNHY